MIPYGETGDAAARLRDLGPQGAGLRGAGRGRRLPPLPLADADPAAALHGDHPRPQQLRPGRRPGGAGGRGAPRRGRRPPLGPGRAAAASGRGESALADLKRVRPCAEGPAHDTRLGLTTVLVLVLLRSPRRSSCGAPRPPAPRRHPNLSARRGSKRCSSCATRAASTASSAPSRTPPRRATATTRASRGWSAATAPSRRRASGCCAGSRRAACRATSTATGTFVTVTCRRAGPRGCCRAPRARGQRQRRRHRGAGARRRCAARSTRARTLGRNRRADAGGRSARRRRHGRAPPSGAALQLDPPHIGTAAGCAAGSSGGPGRGFEPLHPQPVPDRLRPRRDARQRPAAARARRVAVVEIDGFRRSDIATFDRCFGVNPPPIRTIAGRLPQAAAARRRDRRSTSRC